MQKPVTSNTISVSILRTVRRKRGSGCRVIKEVVVAVLSKRWWLPCCQRGGGCRVVKEVVVVVLSKRWWLPCCQRGSGCRVVKEVMVGVSSKTQSVRPPSRICDIAFSLVVQRRT